MIPNKVLEYKIFVRLSFQYFFNKVGATLFFRHFAHNLSPISHRQAEAEHHVSPLDSQVILFYLFIYLLFTY
jgi:hypothetical protein